MASSFPLVIQSGKKKQLQSGDVLLLQSGGAQATSGSLALALNDDTADALSVAQGSDVYIDVTTSDGAEAINIGNATRNNTLGILGSGQVTVAGNVDMTAGADVTGDVFTVGADSWIGLAERASNPGAVANRGDLFVKDVSGTTELFFQSPGVATLQVFESASAQLNSSLVKEASAGFTISSGTIDFDPTGAFTLDMDASQAVTVTTADMAAAMTIQAAGGEDMILIDTDSGNEKITFGNATFNNTTEFLGSGQITMNGTLVAQDVIVNGSSLAINATQVDLADQHILLNSDYVTDAARTFGLVGVTDPAPSTYSQAVAGGGFVAGVASTSDATIEVGSTTGLTVGDFILVTGANTEANNGLYEVHALLTTPTRIAIAGVGTGGSDERVAPNDFTQTNVTTDTVVAGTVTAVAISGARHGTDGLLEQISNVTTTTGLSFTDLASSSGTTLQTAYDNDADGSNVTVTMNATDGKIIWAGDQDMQWTTSGTADFDSAINSSIGFTNSGGEMLFSGGNLQLNDSINLTLGSDDDLTLVHSGTAGSITNAVGALTIENNAAAANIIVELGDNAAATSFVLNDSDSAALLTIDSNGQTDFAGNVDANAGLDVTAGSFTMTGTGIDLDPTGSVTLDMDASQTVTMTLADVASALLIQAAGGEDYIKLDTTGTPLITLGNATDNPGITALGSGDIILSNGTLDVPSGTSFKIGTTALTTANFTAANMDTLLDGSNADSLHTHANVESSQVVVSGLTTTGLADGDAGYISAADTMTKTDATAEASSRFFGFNEGTASSMTVFGLVESAKFTTDGGSPSNGAPVYLALGTADTNTGAGKLTATAPTTAGQFVAEVGLCLNNGNYAGSKTAEVLIQPKAVIEL